MPFLVFEGIDASGKSRLLNLFCKTLQTQGLSFVRTREPGGTKIGAKIREILLQKENEGLDPLAETLLYYADRKQHIKEVLKPHFKKEVWLLSDRYWASTSAYQCGGRGMDEAFVEGLKKGVCEGLEPDLWILLDLSVEEAEKRILKGREGQKDSKDRLEMEKASFHQRVRDYYLKLAKKDPSRWLVLEAFKKPEELLEEILSHLKQKQLLEI